MKKQLQTRPFTLALAGQTNTGKSTVFNLLTGMNQHVGNWPGKTVEKKEGEFSCNGNIYKVMDLPGAYSLSANSTEEIIARDYILKEKPDLVLTVINANTLDRNLYLVAELVTLNAPLLIVLNMMDVAEDEGKVVKPEVLESKLGVKVVPMVASRKKGEDKLIKAIVSSAGKETAGHASIPQVKEEHRAALEKIRSLISGHVPEPYPEDWIALKLLEGDEQISELMMPQLDSRRQNLTDVLKKHKDAMVAVVNGRYEWIKQVTEGVVDRSLQKVVSRTARWDAYATHPVKGFFIMLGILILTLVASMCISAPIAMFVIAKGMYATEAWASGLMPASVPWLAGFARGFVRGVGSVLCMLPVMMAFFLSFAIIEDVGYMARVAYIMDRFLTRMGLHGKSFMPLLCSLTCNVVGVGGCRIVDTHRARLITILVTPIVPCAAQTALCAFIAAMFFSPGVAALVVIGLVLFNFVILSLSGALLHRIMFKGRDDPEFIMELPLYRRPNVKTVWNEVRWRTIVFIKKAGSVIVVFTVALWWLSYFPTGDIKTSYLGMFGEWMIPLGNLMGLDWRMIMTLFSSLLSKEAAVASMGVLFSTESAANLPEILRAAITPAGALAFLVAQMLFLPCTPTIGVMYAESKSLKWVIGMLIYYAFLSLFMAILVYQVLSLFM